MCAYDVANDRTTPTQFSMKGDLPSTCGYDADTRLTGHSEDARSYADSFARESPVIPILGPETNVAHGYDPAPRFKLTLGRMGVRYYDPRLGRWLSRDPMGEAGGFNLYAYCGNDPVNRHDPLGLEGEEEIKPVDEELLELTPLLRGHRPIGGGWIRSPLGQEYRPSADGLDVRNPETGAIEKIYGAFDLVRGPEPISYSREQLDKWQEQFGPFTYVSARERPPGSFMEALTRRLSTERFVSNHYRELERQSGLSVAEMPRALSVREATADAILNGARIPNPLEAHHPTFSVFLRALRQNGWIGRGSLPPQTLSVLETEIHNGLGGVLHPAWNEFVTARGFPGLKVTANTSPTDIAAVFTRPGQSTGVSPTQLFDLLQAFYSTPSGAWQGDGIAIDSVQNLRKELGF